MKDLIQKVTSFIIFDHPVQSEFISRQFLSTHNNFQKQFLHWSLAATRRKVIANFWFSQVLLHFAAIISCGALSVLLFGDNPPLAIKPLVAAVFLAGCICFVIIVVFSYWPVYYSNFLPKLDTIIAQYEKEIKVAAEIKKCKKAQLSNPALVLIYYVFDKVSGINSLQCNDQYAAMLTKLYGVDQGSMKKNLELIYGKKKNLPPRKYTEIQNRFQEAYDFFEEIQFEKGLHILRQLEQKFKVSD